MAPFNHGHFECNFQNWMTQQQQDLEELVQSISTTNDLKQLSEKSVRHFEYYCRRRALLAKHDAPCFMSPPWCSSFEKAFMWVGGCRPSLCIRLLYYVCGSELDEQLDAFLHGERKGNLADLSSRQLELVNALSALVTERRHSVFVQEEIADEPLAMIARTAGRVGEWSQELERAVRAHSKSLAEVLADADRLRLETLKETMAILTPLQAINTGRRASHRHQEAAHIWQLLGHH